MVNMDSAAANLFDIDKLAEAGNKVMVPPASLEPVEPPKRKRGRPRKSETTTPDVLSGDNSTAATAVTANESYIDSYSESIGMLNTAIGEIDILNRDVYGEMTKIRDSKTMKGKYQHMASLAETSSALISTKIGAIKEINNIRTNCHKLELQRMKDTNAAAQNQETDDKYIADLYNAYINTPVNNAVNPLMAMTNANTTNNIPVMMGGIPVGMGHMSEEQRFQDYLQNMTPEQNRMIMDGNSNIETVVIYDPNTGDKMFDVVDMSTGMPVPNYPRPDRGLLDDITIDFSTGIASNTNIGQNWKVMILDTTLNQY